MNVIPSGHPLLGARIEQLDLSKPLSGARLSEVTALLGRYGVLGFTEQDLTPAQFKQFSANFGKLEVHVAGAYREPGHPEVMILSNIVENGQPVGIGDAGQGWHTDLTYSKTVAFANVLYGIEIPVRDGKALGGTSFSDMEAAYQELPQDIKRRIKGRTALHDLAKFYDMMRLEKNSPRPPLTAEQRAAKPPVSHPMVLRHPITGREILYANPGYTVSIDGLSPQESDEILAFLFEHQVQDRFVFTYEWQPGDVLLWDDLRTIHQAIADYLPHERRLIKRCQVMADKFPAIAAA